MKSNLIDELLNHIKQGKRCYCSSEGDEFSTILSLQQNSAGLYLYNYTVSHKYDVIAPTHYDKRILNETELKAALTELPDDIFQHVSYVYKDIINEKTRGKADSIYLCLKQRARIVYVVFKEDRWERAAGRNDYMHFTGMYQTAEQAESMVQYLRTKQGAHSYWKPVTLSLEGEELQLQVELAPQDQLTPTQILATLLDMNNEQLAKFFAD